MDTTVKAVLERYVAAAQGHGEGLESGDHRRANRCYRQKVKALHEIDAASAHGRAPLLDLLAHSNPHVRKSAATHLLKTHPDKATAVLESVARLSGSVGFEAKMVLSEWRNGTLWIP